MNDDSLWLKWFVRMITALCALMLIGIVVIGVYMVVSYVGQPAAMIHPADEVQQSNESQGLRIDPLGKITSPGRCIGWMCM